MPDPPDGVVRDERRAPFCYQTHDTLDVLRATFTGKRRSTALAIYLCLTEAANRTGGADAREGFTAARKEIAEMAGVGLDSLDWYVREMETVGLLVRERRRVGSSNLPNVWVLREPGPDSPPSPSESARGGRVESAVVLGLEETTTKEGETTSPSPPPRLTKVSGRNLGMDALAEECGIIDGDPRYKEVITALNGARGRPGIRALFWDDCLRYIGTHPEEGTRLADILTGDPERFERALEGAVRTKAARYREVMDGAILTPTALAKWWVSVESMRGSGGLTPAEIRRLGANL